MKNIVGACVLACGMAAGLHTTPVIAKAGMHPDHPTDEPRQQEVRKRARTERATIRKRETAPVREASAEISGRIALAAGPRQDVLQGEVSQTVVYFLPAAGADKPSPERFTAATYTKGFDPNLLVVPVGSTVSFPNRDVIIHNVFSSTPGSAFDLGMYRPGETRSQRFDRAGLVVVGCNVHRGMRANVLVLETPHYTRAAADGSFKLSGLPEGKGTLVIWHPRASAQAVAVDGPVAAPVIRTLVASRPRIASYQ
ncbi:hypothetical protein ACFFGH_15910 [Lysobacter korlensis]|uniref:Methylamine utilization protein n=1 Tax=Lysobacter korlensis TaxID=553636 RepID=A0ABV6RQR8_9GAMM